MFLCELRLFIPGTCEQFAVGLISWMLTYPKSQLTTHESVLLTVALLVRPDRVPRLRNRLAPGEAFPPGPRDPEAGSLKSHPCVLA